ncbi:MAG TPA: DIP1984 family protein [Candidatus Enterenecus stercoripullorum]|nr:DIP1984 family protein [Candidatus Enterenecus stercoripullorum]
MKLAEALQERSDLNRQIEQLKFRLVNNAVVQEGEAPAEDPVQLLEQINHSIARLEELMAAINLANCRTVVDGMTLTQLIARKDCLRLKVEAYRDLAEAASQTAHRATRSEIRILSAVDVKAVQGEADSMAKELRLLDNQLQQTNWMTEL